MGELKVLVADDDPQMQLALKAGLARSGHSAMRFPVLPRACSPSLFLCLRLYHLCTLVLVTMTPQRLCNTLNFEAMLCRVANSRCFAPSR